MPDSLFYHAQLSVAPGWKIGGWERWGFRDPWPMICETCGTEMEPLLTIGYSEWEEDGMSWIPFEDQAVAAHPGNLYPPPWKPTMVTIGRGYDMQIYRCPVSIDHGHMAWMQ